MDINKDGVDMSDRIDVGLIITSNRLSLVELAKRLGRDPPNGSHDKGEPKGLLKRGLTWPCTFWRENVYDTDAPLVTQCMQILKQMPPKCIELLNTEPNDISVSLSIAVFYKSAFFNLNVPRSLITELSHKGIDFEITAYPVMEDGSSGKNKGEE